MRCRRNRAQSILSQSHGDGLAQLEGVDAGANERHQQQATVKTVGQHDPVAAIAHPDVKRENSGAFINSPSEEGHRKSSHLGLTTDNPDFAV